MFYVAYILNACQKKLVYEQVSTLLKCFTGTSNDKVLIPSYTLFVQILAWI